MFWTALELLNPMGYPIQLVCCLGSHGGTPQPGHGFWTFTRKQDEPAESQGHPAVSDRHQPSYLGDRTPQRLGSWCLKEWGKHRFGRCIDRPSFILASAGDGSKTFAVTKLVDSSSNLCCLTPHWSINSLSCSGYPPGSKEIQHYVFSCLVSF